MDKIKVDSKSLNLEEKLELYARNNLNVLLIGEHGIGKTTLAKDVAKKLNLKYKYYSASTLDPFADIVGIPAPNKESGQLEFYRPKEIEEAEFIIFDELNRAHPRVLNAVLEIIQFGAVNGNPLPKLKMIWAAINPPDGEYAVEELDPALVDRFHVYVKMKGMINLQYMEERMDPGVAKVLKDWWDTTLSAQQRKLLTPRRIEYMGLLISNDVPWRDAIPHAHPFPVSDLEKRLKLLQSPMTGDMEFEITKDVIVNRPSDVVRRMDVDPSLVIPVFNVAKKLKIDDCFKAREVLEYLAPDLLEQVVKYKFPRQRVLIKDLFEKAGINYKLEYPKITKAFLEEETE